MWKPFGNIGGNADNLIVDAGNKDALASTVEMLLGSRASEGHTHNAQEVFKMINESISKILPEDIAEQVKLPLTQEFDASNNITTTDVGTTETLILAG
jgi:hypothetical protein